RPRRAGRRRGRRSRRSSGPHGSWSWSACSSNGGRPARVRPATSRLAGLVRARPHLGAMARILVTEKIADGGLQRLRDVGHVVDVRLGLSPDELIGVVPGAAGLIIRSATQVTREVLEAGDELVVVG